MVSYILRHTVQEFCLRIYKNAQIFKKKKDMYDIFTFCTIVNSFKNKYGNKRKVKNKATLQFLLQRSHVFR